MLSARWQHGFPFHLALPATLSGLLTPRLGFRWAIRKCLDIVMKLSLTELQILVQVHHHNAESAYCWSTRHTILGGSRQDQPWCLHRHLLGGDRLHQLFRYQILWRIRILAILHQTGRFGRPHPLVSHFDIGRRTKSRQDRLQILEIARRIQTIYH